MEHGFRTNDRKMRCGKSFNAYLDTLQHKIFEAKRKLIETHQTLNPENIKNKLLEKWNQPKYYAHGNI